MGVFIDYALQAEGTAEDVASRLEKVRQRCLDLPLASVSEVRRITPIYTALYLNLFESNGYVLPEPVARRVREVEDDPDHGQLCMRFGMLPGRRFSNEQVKRYLAPAEELMKSTDLWRKDELPKELTESTFGFTVMSLPRAAIELEFANVLLRHGYLLTMDPGEGSEPVSLGLATYGLPQSAAPGDLPLWYGDSFTRTQYAKEFIAVHETVCKVLDIVQEEGLLLQASDTCGYYATRSWEGAGEQVNDEMELARTVADMIGLGIGNLREEGVSVKVVCDNASKANPVDFTEAIKREQGRRSSPKAPRKADP